MGIDYDALLVYGWVVPLPAVMSWCGAESWQDFDEKIVGALKDAGLPDGVRCKHTSPYFDAATDDCLYIFDLLNPEKLYCTGRLRTEEAPAPLPDVPLEVIASVRKIVAAIWQRHVPGRTHSTCPPTFDPMPRLHSLLNVW